MASNKLATWHSPLWLAGLQLAALWPHWMWMARRTLDGSDEPWGVIAMLTLAGLVLIDRHRLNAHPSEASLVAAGLLTLLAAWGSAYLPPIVAAALAMLALAALLAGLLPFERPRAPLAVLALLALPLAASLNFYLGYPLRWLCAQGSAALLSLIGWSVTPEGAALLWNGKTILVDAPCAGIAMLWVGLYAAALLSYLHGASVLRTAFNLSAAAAIVLIGNTVRNAALFFKEAGVVQLPNWTHEGIGLLVFVLMFLAMYWLFSWRPYATR